MITLHIQSGDCYKLVNFYQTALDQGLSVKHSVTEYPDSNEKEAIILMLAMHLDSKAPSIVQQ